MIPPIGVADTEMRDSFAVYVKRQIRTSNREVEVEEPHGSSLFGFTECLIQDVPPKPTSFVLCSQNQFGITGLTKPLKALAHQQRRRDPTPNIEIQDSTPPPWVCRRGKTIEMFWSELKKCKRGETEQLPDSCELGYISPDFQRSYTLNQLR